VLGSVLEALGRGKKPKTAAQVSPMTYDQKGTFHKYSHPTEAQKILDRAQGRGEVSRDGAKGDTKAKYSLTDEGRAKLKKLTDVEKAPSIAKDGSSDAQTQEGRARRRRRRPHGSGDDRHPCGVRDPLQDRDGRRHAALRGGGDGRRDREADHGHAAGARVRGRRPLRRGGPDDPRLEKSLEGARIVAQVLAANRARDN
jgi:DNA-binding PadR family transcriptional regulator